MTSIDKLSKSFEFLKIPTQLYDPEQRKQDVKQINKKDKISQLNLIHDNIISTNVRQADDYSRMLSHAIEAFLVYFDDDDQDVYFVAEECLNKTIKALIETNLTRFPADLYRFLRKNGPERSLRGALIRFAELCHLIKPHKCRIYVDFIIKENTLSKIANRTEESIQSVLVSSMNKICSAFCWSMSDNEIKALIQSFLPNLSNDSSVNSYRRVSANCLSIICLYSRLPYSSYYNLHQELLNLVLPLEENNDLNTFTVWGVLLCFRFMIIHIAELDKSLSHSSSSKSKALFSTSNSFNQQNNLKQNLASSSTSSTTNPLNKKLNSYFGLLNLCQIYEICVFYLNNEDNRIVIASLECLQVLLKLTPLKFNSYLTKTGYTNQTFLLSKNMNLPKNKKLLETNSVNNNLNSSSLSLLSHNNKLSSSMDSLSTLKPTNQINSESDKIDDETNHSLDDLNSSSNLEYVRPPIPQIGSFYDKEKPPILYLIRLLSFKFLLNTTNDSDSKLKSDQEVKILVKAIALDCCSSLLSLSPHLVFKSLFDQVENSNLKQDLYISDLIEYINHSDDKMRSTTSLLIGQFINSVLVNKLGDYDSWLAKNIPPVPNPNFKLLKLEILIDYLMRFIRIDNSKLTNNICKRFALSSFRSFLPALVKTRFSSYSLEILINLIHLKHSTYNLVKCELVDLLASIDFKSINYIEQELSSDSSKSFLEDYDDDLDTNKQTKTANFNPFVVRDTQERIIEEVFLYLLGSDDSKVRLETARSLTRFVLNMNFYELSSIPNQNLLLSAGENALKSEGYAPNFLNTSLIDNDANNLSSIGSFFDKNKINQTQTSSSSSFSSSSNFITPTSILHGGSNNSKRQIKYSSSPLSSVSFLSSLPWLSKTNQILINNFIQPFHSLIKYWPTKAPNTGTINNNLNKIVEHNLAYLVPMLIKTLIKSIDKYQFLGCLEVLDFIFQTYQPALFYSSPLTNDSDSNSQLTDLINLLISYLKHPNVSFDLYTHDIVLRLIGNLYCALTWLNMKKLDKTLQQLNFNLNNINQNAHIIQNLLEILNNSIKNVPFPQSQAELSTGLNYTYSFVFNNQSIKSCVDQLFVHTMRMLCVLACVIDESALPSNLTSNLSAGSTAVTAPPPPPPAPVSNITNTTSLQSSTINAPLNNPSSVNSPTQTTGSPSFIRSKITNLTESKLTKNNSNASLTSSNSSNSVQSPQKDSSKPPITITNEPQSSILPLPKTTNNVHLGFFQNSSHYLKLYELIRTSFYSYKKSANINTYDRFTQIIKTTLNLFAQLLESSLSVHEIGPHLDEILLYLKIIFSIEPSSSVKCVTLCLKSLFSLNLSGLMFEYIQQQLNKINSQTNISQATGNQNNTMQIPVPISGLSSVLSTSLTSLASFNQTMPFNHLNSFSNNSKRLQTSLFTSIIQNHLGQFTRFMYSQTLMFKNDNSMGIQFNPNSNLINLGLDSIEYINNSGISTNSNITSTTNSSAITNSSNSNAPISNATSSTTTTVAKVSSKTPFGTGFNLFNFMKKKQENVTTPNPTPTQQPQQQQPQSQPIQDQKLKQQKELKTIGQYIKSFESIVIKSLRQYTLTTSVNLQTKILELLTHLIFLKVDYCLLDSDKVFIEYVLKQFEYLEQKRMDDLNEDIENGANLLAKSYLTDLYESFDSESSISDPLNPFDLDTMLNKLYSSLEGFNSTISNLNSSIVNTPSGSSTHGSLNSPLTSNLNLKQQEHQRTHILIPKLFDFLILLSHEKKLNPPSPVKSSQQKPGRNSGLLTIPEIMQLCDNLIASENSPHTHAIPALRPLVIDLFLNRTNEDSRELDMQHDVIMMTMLRLIQYPSVWPLLTIAVLKFKRDNEDKWKKSSRQICDALFDSMRSTNTNMKLKFFEYNGNELRAIRRYSQSYVPHIESIKQLFQLFNSLAPQVFRPIDFIILSLFEILKPLFNQPDLVSYSDLNNYLCLVIIHTYLLLTNSSEDQILIRLHHLTPQIVASYKESNIKMGKFNHKTSRSKQAGNDESSTDSSVNSSRKNSVHLPNDQHTETSGLGGSSSNFDNYDESDNINDPSAYYLDPDDIDFDLTDSAIFLSKFLLRILEISFTKLKKQIKFNLNFYFSSQNIASSSSAAFLRDSELNIFRDLNHMQHIISNKLIFILYIVNSGNYPKLANAFSMLIDNKTGDTNNCNNKKYKKEEGPEEEKEDEVLENQGHLNDSDSDEEEDDNKINSELKLKEIKEECDDFGFNASKFTFKINKFILFKLSKINPILSSMWQYLLLLCNYQDPEYWLLSLETNSTETNNQIIDFDNNDNNQDFLDSSNNSSNNNSLNPNLQHDMDNLNLSSENQLTTAKLLRSKIRSQNNYASKDSKHHNRTSSNRDSTLKNQVLFYRHFKYLTLNEQLFKHLSLTAFCDHITTRNQLDNTTGLTMLIINNLVDLFELASHESTVLDLFSTIHRNASASSLFIHSINSNWSNIISKKKLYLLHSCLKSVEGVHLASSGHLLNLLIEKFFCLPYLSLVRYADHIACQRVEMMQSLSPDELSMQLNEQHLKILDRFFNEQFKYSYRHQRLISLLEQLKRVINDYSQGIITSQYNGNDTPSSPFSTPFYDKGLKMSPSIDFFMLYVNSNSNKSTLNNLDKEWYYNIVRSACCYSSSANDLIADSSALKSKQCALILSNLDFSNSQSILNDKTFRLNILKDCLLIGAYRTQMDIEKLPSALKKAKNILKDFMHPLWVASTQFLFDLLKNLSFKLPKPVRINLTDTRKNFKSRFTSTNPADSDLNLYEQKLNDLLEDFDVYSFVAPITEAINAFLKCIRQYPCLEQQLSNENSNYLIDFILFQISFFNFVSIQKSQILTLESLNQTFLCVFNLLVDQQLLNPLCQHSHFSTLVSYLIKDFYQLLIYYFFRIGDENLINTPILSSKTNIDYSNGQKYTNDVLFNTITFETLLKLRFIITNSASASSSLTENSESLNDSFRVSSNTHVYLQLKSQFFREKIPFNMRDLCEKIYIGLCRLPVIDRFMRIPDTLWRTPGFKLEYSQFMKTDTTTLPPLDYLRDPQILKEHLKHVLLVGWTTRNQFEFEYVNMLTFFHNISEDYYLPMSSTAQSSFNTGHSSTASNTSLSSEDPDSSAHNQLVSNLPTEEIKERNKCICLLIKGLSTWLIKSSLTPKSGNTLNSLYEQVSRNKYPGFLHTQLGKQYSQVKRVTDTFNRFNLFTEMNSISISNNSNLLYMLDPTLIDDIDRNRKKSTVQTLDFTQPQPPDSLANLLKISTSLRQTNYYNLLFSTNIERLMLNNLPTNSDSYFYFTQISLEGILKFLGQWNKAEPKATGTTIGESIQNLVNSTSLPTSAIIDEVSAGIIRVAEFLSEDTDLISRTSDTETLTGETYSTNNFLVQRSFNRNSLDITSVLRTVLDYYESFFKIPSLQLKLDIFKSMLYLSNCLFDSKQQYESLIQKLQFNFEFLNLFIQQENDLMLMPSVNELIDESTLSLAIYAECLCRCCLQTSKDTSSMSGKDFERLNKLIENGLKSNSVSIKISTIHGLIYWLELITLGYLGNNNDAKQLIDHLCKQIYQMKDISVYLTANSKYISSLWSAVFYTIENCLDSIRDAQNFCAAFIKLTYTILNDTNTPYFLFYQLYMGLERFLLSSMVPSFEINTIQRLFSSKLYDEQRSLCLVSLTVTSLYASNQSKQINYWNDIIAPQYKTTNSNLSASHSGNILNSGMSSPSSSLLNSPVHHENPIENQTDTTIGYPQILELTAYPDLQTHLLKVLEVATNFLDRMKSSSTSKEASLYASLLPKILCDFLPPHDLLNKLITEFLNSSQHPYPEAVAYVLFKCFDLLQEKGLQSQIQEWCLLSLSNFLQRTSIYESIWLTSCLLVSATQNQWLKSTFPFLLNRYCAFQTIDRAIFYMSVIEFRKQFIDKTQIQSIHTTFEAVAKPGTPYEELIKLLNSQESDLN